eukprot:661823-Amphidinium_carterae.1
MLIYSRDTCIAGLQAVTEMFSAIVNGEFDPDATRALIVARRLAEGAPVEKSLVVDALDGGQQ